MFCCSENVLSLKGSIFHISPCDLFEESGGRESLEKRIKGHKQTNGKKGFSFGGLCFIRICGGTLGGLRRTKIIT